MFFIRSNVICFENLNNIEDVLIKHNDIYMSPMSNKRAVDKKMFIYNSMSYYGQLYDVVKCSSHEEAEKKFDNLESQGIFQHYMVFTYKDNKYIPIGMAILYPCFSDKRASFAFFVLPYHQKKGYGTKIVKAIIAKYASLGYSAVESMVHINNIASNKVMHKAGFKIIEQNALLRGIIANRYEILI